MKVSDYIVDFLIQQGVTDCFGYPGGSVTNLMDSIRKREQEIRGHVTYHEQGAAFAACGYASSSGRLGMAYATGGPGCTNLLTGIGNAYYDSVPVLFLTGNVNTYESKGNLPLRQRSFQESDNLSAAKPFTKYAAYVESPERIRYYLEKACYYAMEGRRGPVFLDLPMDIQRAQIEPEELEGFEPPENRRQDSELTAEFAETVSNALESVRRPCLILGKGIYGEEALQSIRAFIEKFHIPYVTSMISFDVIGPHQAYYGFLGAYGTRSANFITAKSDLILSIGSRLDIRQVGAKRADFAPNARIIRVDIDENELNYKIHENESGFCMDSLSAARVLRSIACKTDFSDWLGICEKIRSSLKNTDRNTPNTYIEQISELFPEEAVITVDVGQNQVWVAQSMKLKSKQRVYFSGGFGSMGYALPAAIGACYGSSVRNIICICGDGGMQMNIQEMQYLVRERLPIKIIVFNNQALGMIRHFQEMYFDGIYYQTRPEGGFTSPDFTKIAGAYGIRAVTVNSPEGIADCRELLTDDQAVLIELRYDENTYIIPKLKYGNPNQDQDPPLDRELFAHLMKL